MDEIEIEQARLDALMLQKEKRIAESGEFNEDGFFTKPKHQQTTPAVINRV